MNCCGEGRSIGKVRIFKILQNSIHIDSHDSDVDHLVHCTGAHHLCSQQLVGGSVCDQLSDKEACPGIIMGLVICDSHYRLDRISCGQGLCLGQAGSAAVQAGQLHNAGPQHTGIILLTSGEDLRQGTALQIGGGAHGRPGSSTCQAVGHHTAVPYRVDIFQGCLQGLIHQDRSLIHLHTGI